MDSLVIKLKSEEVTFSKLDSGELEICIDDDFLGGYAVVKIDKNNLEKLKNFIKSIEV